MFTVTDFLTYHVETPDIYGDMRGFSDQLDTSIYPPTHKLFSFTYESLLGKMKDECSGKPPVQFVGLRSKMYSLLEKDGAKMTAKGVNSSVLQTSRRGCLGRVSALKTPWKTPRETVSASRKRPISLVFISC